MKRSLLLFLLNILIISFFSQEVFSLSDNSGQRDISSFVKKDGRENPATDDFLTNEEDTGLESCQDSLARENELTFSDKIMKVKAENIFRDSTFYHWCSSVIKGEDGKYHLFYSRWKQDIHFLCLADSFDHSTCCGRSSGWALSLSEYRS